MGRTYAAVLGITAFATTVVRGLIHGNGFQSTANMAIVWLFVFAVIGSLIGELAAWIVDDSIRSSMQAEPSLSAGEPTK